MKYNSSSEFRSDSKHQVQARIAIAIAIAIARGRTLLIPCYAICSAICSVVCSAICYAICHALCAVSRWRKLKLRVVLFFGRDFLLFSDRDRSSSRHFLHDSVSNGLEARAVSSKFERSLAMLDL